MTITHRIAAASAAACVALGLTACDNGHDPASWPLDDSTVAVDVAPAPAPQPSAHTPAEVAYLATLNQHGVYYLSDAAAIRGGRAVCDYLDAAVPYLGLDAALWDAGQIAVDAGGYSLGDSARIVGAAVGSFCPAYLAGGEV